MTQAAEHGPTAESGKEWRRIFDALPDAAFELDPSGRYLYVNAATAAGRRCRREDMIGRNQSEFFEPVVADFHRERLEHVVRTGVADSGESPFHRDGATGWFEYRLVPICDAAGAVVSVLGFGRDISARKRLEAERDRLSAIVEQASEAVIMTDLEGALVYVNPAFERITGYRREEVIGRNPRLLKSGMQPASFYHELWAALLRGETWSGRLVNRCKDGSTYVADAVISPVRDSSQRTVNYVGIQRDVTREEGLDEQLRQAQKMEAVGQLTGGLAHDFNNLLTIVLGSSALVRGDLRPDQGGAAAYLDDLEGAARRGSELIRKLLAFSRRERLTLASCDLAMLVGDLAGTLRRLVPESIEIRVERDTSAPPVHVDQHAVEQILLNLATNARDAMPSGGRLTLQVGSRTFGDEDGRTAHEFKRSGTFARVAVSDTGFGMTADTLARIFEPFFTTKPPGGGTGLGLAMVYGLMKQQRGFVTVYSEPGHGTTVNLYFPANGKHAAAPGARAVREPAACGRGETVLVVEDEPGLRRIATRVLERNGYRVLEAADGADGLRVFEEHATTIDLVLSDMIMPRLSGAELLAALRERGRAVPFVLASGYAAGDLRARDGVGPGTHVVEKPWTANDLLAALRRALDEASPAAG